MLLRRNGDGCSFSHVALSYPSKRNDPVVIDCRAAREEKVERRGEGVVSVGEDVCREQRKESSYAVVE